MVEVKYATFAPHEASFAIRAAVAILAVAETASFEEARSYTIADSISCS